MLPVPYDGNDGGRQTKSRTADLNHGSGGGRFTPLGHARAPATVLASDSHIDGMTAFVSPRKTDGCIYREVEKLNRFPRFLDDLSHMELCHLNMGTEKL